jgi:hypothetical protein
LRGRKTIGGIVKLLGILVLISAVAGYWVHQQRAQKAAAGTGAIEVSAAGVWQPYTPRPGAAPEPRKARVTGVRLISTPATFQAQVQTAALEVFIRRVEEQASDVLRPAKQGSVRVHVTTGPTYQTVQVQAQGVEGVLLQMLHERLMVKSSDVAFELQIAIAP